MQVLCRESWNGTSGIRVSPRPKRMKHRLLTTILISKNQPQLLQNPVCGLVVCCLPSLFRKLGLKRVKCVINFYVKVSVHEVLHEVVETRVMKMELNDVCGLAELRKRKRICAWMHMDVFHKAKKKKVCLKMKFSNKKNKKLH